ncbi:hypothetical protein UFOVP469_28 [uncultured Caudovirales phage]|uniref:Uncharacterized protein n=1 Tax=uncultured Caudovirales phage TaxID=2100421 RepID=A0A6J5MF13_9CAUD|nr:hypothetical protein UFOVP469_28 [uncultured Caudovirales phage]
MDGFTGTGPEPEPPESAKQAVLAMLKFISGKQSVNAEDTAVICLLVIVAIATGQVPHCKWEEDQS